MWNQLVPAYGALKIESNLLYEKKFKTICFLYRSKKASIYNLEKEKNLEFGPILVL